jgi:hypothetical protein
LLFVGLVALALASHGERARGLAAGSGLLLIDAMGSAAEAVFHGVAM